MLKYFLDKLHVPKPFTGNIITREQPCRMCGGIEALTVATVDFWDLQRSDIVKCSECGHIQLDPMLTNEATETGCNAYLVEETINTSINEQERNLIRNYRRGILFAFHLKRIGFNPGTILEFGPGSGYFSAGVQFIFPGCKVTVVDIVDEVLRNNKEIHGFQAFKGTPENLEQLEGVKFDLVIARDIIEHVTDISKVTDNVVNHLNDNGLFLFITPNGHEDVWGHYVNHILKNTHSELLINHVNYFDGTGLLKFLENKGLSPVSYYTYQVKTTFRGKGWKITPKLSANPTSKRASGEMIKRMGEVTSKPGFEKKKILQSWLFSGKLKWITVFWCWYHHFTIIRLSPKLNVGHEILGLFIKKVEPENHSQI
jgi:2-polyprenyl-3-methyl-5-hydroxy-6-metoxy-1,4-benzoquinol methylase